MRAISKKITSFLVLNECIPVWEPHHLLLKDCIPTWKLIYGSSFDGQYFFITSRESENEINKSYFQELLTLVACPLSLSKNPYHLYKSKSDYTFWPTIFIISSSLCYSKIAFFILVFIIFMKLFVYFISLRLKCQLKVSPSKIKGSRVLGDFVSWMGPIKANFCLRLPQ